MPADYSDVELLRWAVAYAGDLAHERKPRWAHVMDMFPFGRTAAHDLCLRFQVDPDEEVGIHHAVAEEEEVAAEDETGPGEILAAAQAVRDVIADEEADILRGRAPAGGSPSLRASYLVLCLDRDFHSVRSFVDDIRRGSWVDGIVGVPGFSVRAFNWPEDGTNLLVHSASAFDKAVDEVGRMEETP